MQIYLIRSSIEGKLIIRKGIVEEKPKTYKLLEGEGHFVSRTIMKGEIDIYNPTYNQVITFDLKKGIDIYEEAVNQLLEFEIKRHQEMKDKFLNIKSEIEKFKQST